MDRDNTPERDAVVTLAKILAPRLGIDMPCETDPLNGSVDVGDTIHLQMHAIAASALDPFKYLTLALHFPDYIVGDIQEVIDHVNRFEARAHDEYISIFNEEPGQVVVYNEVISRKS